MRKRATASCWKILEHGVLRVKSEERGLGKDGRENGSLDWPQAHGQWGVGEAAFVCMEATYE